MATYGIFNGNSHNSEWVRDCKAASDQTTTAQGLTVKLQIRLNVAMTMMAIGLSTDNEKVWLRGYEYAKEMRDQIALLAKVMS
jgi:hypothetical protein